MRSVSMWYLARHLKIAGGSRMIFGYVSRKEDPLIEDMLINIDPDGTSYRYSGDRCKAFLFVDSSNYCKQPLWESAGSLILCNGIPVDGSFTDHYQILDTLPEQVVENGVEAILNDIVSNVNLCILQNINGRIKVIISSDRASAYKFYYRRIDSALFFSTDYSLLMKVAPCQISKASIYSIFKYNMPPAPNTIIEDIFVVPPSHYYEYDLSGGRGNCYPYFKFEYKCNEKADLQRLESILDAEAAVISEMSPTMLMSGGVDSTLFACKLHDRSKSQGTAYFISYGTDDHELEYAEQAARASDHRLTKINMKESELCSTIADIGKLSCMPFNDYSFITTYYLMKQINKNKDQTVIDCTGADGCFGFYLLSDRSKWVNGHRLPITLKHLFSNVYSHTGIWMYSGRAETLFSFISTLDNGRLELCPTTSTPNNCIFPDNKTYDADADRSFNDMVDVLNAGTHGGFEEYVTTMDISHTCCSVFSQKTYLSNDMANTKTIYPYLWKDMLVEQGNLSWRLKVKDGIVKYPLKKILENYMPHDFVHRPKSGFTSSLSKAFTSKPMIGLLASVDRSNYAGVIDDKKLDDIIAKLSNPSSHSALSNPLKYSMWGMIYIDQWIKNHPVSCSN